MSTVLGTQKFHSLEVVDSAKFDNEVLFEDLTLDGTDMSIVCAGSFTVTSLAVDTTTPTPAVDHAGIVLRANEDVVVSSLGNTKVTAILSGQADVFGTGTGDADGTVVIGHTDNSANANATVAVAQFGWTGGVDTMGFFSATPVAQQTLPAAATDPTTTQALANAIRAAMIAYGMAV